MKKLVLTTALLCTSIVFARPYKYYLDPERAEQVLAGINLKPRLGNEDWLKIINFDKNEKRQVQSGDNLWKISKSRFGNPFLWRKIWQENPWLTNPHDLEVGRMLAYYREELDSNPIKSIPIIKLRPEKAGTVTDVDNDIYVNRVLKARYRVNHLVVKEDDFLGEVSGAYTVKSGVSVNDEFYIAFFDEKKAEVGSTFAVVREEQDLRDKTKVGEPLIGQLVRVVGEVRVLANEDNLSRVELFAHFDNLERGDKIILSPKIVSDNNSEFPSKDLVPQIVMGDESSKNFISQGELVVLNKGLSHGMKAGYLFKVFQDTDPLKETRDKVRPISKGEVRVVYAGDESSIGVVNRAKDPLRVGDSLVSFPELPDRPVPPRLIKQEIEIN
jgi:hypothetical protein